MVWLMFQSLMPGIYYINLHYIFDLIASGFDWSCVPTPTCNQYDRNANEQNLHVNINKKWTATRHIFDNKSRGQPTPSQQPWSLILMDKPGGDNSGMTSSMVKEDGSNGPHPMVLFSGVCHWLTSLNHTWLVVSFAMANIIANEPTIPNIGHIKNV